MKKLFCKLYVFAICFFYTGILFSHDIYYVNRTETLYTHYSPHSGVVSELHEGEEINIVNNFIGTDTSDVRRLKIETNDGRTGWLAVDAISVRGSMTLPEDITENIWAHSYYFDILQSGKRDTLFFYEPFWRDNFDKYKDTFGDGSRDYFWYEGAFMSRIMFKNIIDRFYEYSWNRFEFINGEIAYNDGLYFFTAYCIHVFKGYDESLLESHFTVGNEINIGLKPDGDYLEVFINDEFFFTLVKWNEELQTQFNNLMKTDAFDISRIQWPRLADGSMDYPPPANMSGFRTSHATTDRLRLRDNPATASLIVTTLDQGTEVQVLETGSNATIDGLTAPWVKVLSANGYTGWCFSGYLEPLQEEAPIESFAVPENTNSVPEMAADRRGASSLLWAIGGVVLFVGVILLVLIKRKRR